MLSVSAGLRADTRSLSSDATPQLALQADDRSWSESSGDIGFVLRPMPELAFVVNGGTGWRAPTLFELYTNGPNIADARYEIGDPAMKNERSHNVDGGVRWASARVRADVSVYQNTFDRFIYLQPTGATDRRTERVSSSSDGRAASRRRVFGCSRGGRPAHASRAATTS